LYRLTAQGAASFGADSDIGADIRLVRAILNRPTRPRGGFVGSDHLQRYWDRTSTARRSGLLAYVVLYQVGHEANPADLSQPDILMFRVRRIWPHPEAAWRLLTPGSWAEALLQIRRWACAKLDGVAANDPRW